MASLYCRDFDRSLTLYQRALELNANSADLLADMADAMVHLGRVEDGIALIKDAIRFNPFCPEWYHWVRGIAAFAEGRYGDALSIFLALKDLSNFLRADIVSTYARIGLPDQAKRVASDMLRVQPDYRVGIEKLRPFKDLTVQQRLMEDLVRAGLPL
jgi:tetratricopeptide (TPR) repeat protein